MYRCFETTLGPRAREVLVLAMLLCSSDVRAQDLEAVSVEGQPLAANVERVVRTLESLARRLLLKLPTHSHVPAPRETPGGLQHRLDNSVLLVVTINPEERGRVRHGRGLGPGGSSRAVMWPCSSR